MSAAAILPSCQIPPPDIYAPTDYESIHSVPAGASGFFDGIVTGESGQERILDGTLSFGVGTSSFELRDDVAILNGDLGSVNDEVNVETGRRRSVPGREKAHLHLRRPTRSSLVGQPRRGHFR